MIGDTLELLVIVFVCRFRLFTCDTVVCLCLCLFFVFFFQAEDGIRYAQESRGLGDVYKRQRLHNGTVPILFLSAKNASEDKILGLKRGADDYMTCLLYTSDAADDLLCVDLGGRRIIKKKKQYKSIVENSI